MQELVERGGSKGSKRVQGEMGAEEGYAYVGREAKRMKERPRRSLN